MMYRPKLNFPLFIICLAFLVSCHEKGNNQLNNKAFKEEVKNKELKRISSAEISNAAYQQGRMIVDSAEQMLLSVVHGPLVQNDSLVAALELYRTTSRIIKDSLAANYQVTINRVSLKAANKANEPDELEGMLLDAYLYNVENSLPLEDNLQEIDKAYFLYTRPITISSTACLQCHGEIEAIASENYQALKKYYPGNTAFGYKLNDFRGMWTVKLSKKELIKNL